MKYVRIKNERVMEILPQSTYQPGIAYWYGESFAAQCAQAPDQVEQNWVYADGVFSEPGPEPESEPESDPITDLELALAELAEIVLGG